MLDARPRIAVYMALAALVLITGCGGSDIYAASDEEDDDAAEPESTLLLEEGAASREILFRNEGEQVSGLALFMGEVKMRLVPWRYVPESGAPTYNVRMSFFLSTFIGEQELSWFQLTARQADDLIAFIADFQEVRLREAAQVVDYRRVTGSWGDFQLRLDDEGTFASAAALDSWFRIDLDLLKRSLEESVGDLKALAEAQPSAEF